MPSKTGLLTFLAVALNAAAAFGEQDDLIEVRVGKQSYRGRAVAHDSSAFWLLGQDGRLRQLPIDEVTSFRKLAPTFRGLSAADLRSRLRREFGHEYEVAGTTYYLVVAPKGQARAFADLFDSVYRKFTSYFSSRGIRLKRPPFPMVAVVFGSAREFSDYARKEGVSPGYGVLGYYHRLSNRVALYASGATSRGSVNGRIAGRINAPPSGALRDVIIHEATHQAAFNTGLHSRLGSTPTWVVEGLATVFEAPGVRNRTGSRGAKSRVNAGRLADFRAYAAKTRKPRSLAAFLSSDRSFSNPSRAYAEAWALSFFLIERKSSLYTRYIRLLTRRDPLKPYVARGRLADFQSAFGKDLDALEVDYLRFVQSLE